MTVCLKEEGRTYDRFDLEGVSMGKMCTKEGQGAQGDGREDRGQW